MSNQIHDFPQDELPEDEITKKEAPVRKYRRPRGKPLLGKVLFILLIAGVIIGGFILLQKTLLDLEAEAQIYAVKTIIAFRTLGPATATPVPATLASFPQNEITPTGNITLTPGSSNPTQTLNPVFEHTATIAAQLTLAAK